MNELVTERSLPENLLGNDARGKLAEARELGVIMILVVGALGVVWLTRHVVGEIVGLSLVGLVLGLVAEVAVWLWRHGCCWVVDEVFCELSGYRQ